MRSLDTNILARWLLRDDPEQTAIADTIMDGPVEITATVLVELAWVLQRIGGMSREDLARTLSAILSIDDAYVFDRDGLRWAVDRYRAGADWPDMVHLLQTSRARSFVTFDQSMAREAGLRSPIPIELASN